MQIGLPIRNKSNGFSLMISYKYAFIYGSCIIIIFLIGSNVSQSIISPISSNKPENNTKDVATSLSDLSQQIAIINQSLSHLNSRIETLERRTILQKLNKETTPAIDHDRITELNSEIIQEIILDIEENNNDIQNKQLAAI